MKKQYIIPTTDILLVNTRLMIVYHDASMPSDSFKGAPALRGSNTEVF